MRTSVDLCVYVRQSDDDSSFVIIYVNDLMFFARNQEHIDAIKCGLKTVFSIKC